ncbi:N-acetylglucosamine-specific PTS transporter subunit IIBC [Loigolactobacillus backii]|uniref:PTS system sucrose-specific EIIBCA component n=1 Tax=Loigolactobacillus backii TaxID=375175 RepID=A0A192H0H6_9LACO|nr:N-acetylglucosamine-specific PTS transporter subunit IIBC [Loigolactobacillus backii]ANK61783.1 PTS N-acetylglucosamine transporter subunit IIABC [Loigolactobacillus backii]ANK69023.1 PTS N-acetylglucosamine transporter subunit IIABC [Loigolactobacillus backii]MDA5387182.1 N-acetylglucosamine-specific PTS transporter subunit IIBC [Loigolactobacillus backii]MDA5389744.1 N-acetylglucosamine-specific PTS transporter subunit IIBC [Loigolactobacillus backii]
MKAYLQRMGRSLQLPVAVLPAAALLVGIGHWLPQKWAAAQFLQSGGNAILTNLALLFAGGLALGMSKDKDGASALAGLVAFIVPVYVLDPAQVSTLLGIKLSAVDPAFAAIKGNVLIGIIAGLVAAALYNRFHETKLPMALSFFSGKRLVPILASLVMLVVSLVLLFVWPPLYEALVSFAKFIVGLGAVGAGLYGFFNRLLIPTGLHQALNSVFWFNVAGINDIGKFWAGEGVKGVTGMYQAGFFPVMMFGLPAGAYAIYKNARPERKRETASLMLAGAFASFFTGVTEPLEFSFMFVAWPLYVIHAVFTGISLAFAAFMHWTAGFTFSAGLVDFVLSSHLPIANMPYMLLVQGLVMAVIYYFGFDFAIKKFNLMTPGREPVEETTDADTDIEVATDSSDDKYTVTAKKVYAAIGGKDNITDIENCTTRLRLQLKDTDKVNKAAIRGAGAVGMNVLDKTNIQIVIGTEVQFVADALTKLFETGAPISNVANSPAAPAKPIVDPNINSGAVDTFYSVAQGQLLDIEQVSDPTFAQKMLGDGYAIEPVNGEVVSPIDGEILTIFPTKHAIGLKTTDGLEVLVHMGLDTVELKGAPFDIKVKQGQKVKHGDVLANADLQAIKDAGKKSTMIVIVTNMPNVAYMKFAELDRSIAANNEVVKVTVK